VEVVCFLVFVVCHEWIWIQRAEMGALISVLGRDCPSLAGWVGRLSWVACGVGWAPSDPHLFWLHSMLMHHVRYYYYARA
jgi:hypothetical protein